jgi:hypothetical protein
LYVRKSVIQKWKNKLECKVKFYSQNLKAIDKKNKTKKQQINNFIGPAIVGYTLFFSFITKKKKKITFKCYNTSRVVCVASMAVGFCLPRNIRGWVSLTTKVSDHTLNLLPNLFFPEKSIWIIVVVLYFIICRLRRNVTPETLPNMMFTYLYFYSINSETYWDQVRVKYRHERVKIQYENIILERVSGVTLGRSLHIIK